MAHIELPKGLPGILGPMAFRPETAKPLSELAEVLLRGPSSLSSWERELIAAYVSSLNNCLFCMSSHAAASEAWHPNRPETIYEVIKNPDSNQISLKMRALLVIAKKVQSQAKTVSAVDIDFAKSAGATDRELHDTVLIAAAFCMYNRYVDGLATEAPPAGSSAYREMGVMLKERGYINT
jgi:uncharacterized peroxidase-related enzyme